MSTSKHYDYKEQEDVAAWDASSAYTKHVATPTAPSMSGHDHVSPTHDAAYLPFAVAVESSGFHQPASGSRAPGTATAATATAAAGSAPATVTAPRPSRRSKTQSCLTWLPTLLLFHTCNFALGVTAFVVVVTLLPLSVGLLPLCCIGVVVFRLTALATEWFAAIDVALANLVARDDSAKLRVHPRMGNSSSSSRHDKTMLARLVFVSPRNLVAMAYFATLKFAVGVLSACAVGCAVGYPVCAIVFAWDADVQMCGFTYEDRPVAYVFASIGITLAGFALLPAVASLSRKVSQCVCADDSHSHSRQSGVAVTSGTLV